MTATVPISDDYLTHLRSVAALAIENHSPFCYMSASTVDSIAAELIRLRAELADTHRLLEITKSETARLGVTR